MTLLDLAVKIGVDDQASSKVSKISEHLGNGLKRAAQIGTAAVAAASAAVIKLAKDSIDAYADYEQLVGGVDTLFKNSSKKLQQYAANAYKTAGLSANQYMETATSFSASLLQSLEGDTEAAVEYADMAITDMADNANKMGTSIEMIQNAYQGFAKQNYTMLDNLKLGYGGTATEMARLINDSGILKDKLIDLTDTKNIGYQISKVGLAGIAEAIHIVQTEMGITGTTAKEAEGTISGSVASMKAAWENLKTGIADENADIDELIDKFILSADTAANNLADRALVTIDKIKGIFEDPEQRQKFIDLGKEIFEKIIKGLTGDEYAKANLAYVSGWLAGSLYEALSDAINAAWNLIKGTATDEDFGTDFTRGLMHGSETLRNSGQFSWGYGTNDTREGPSAGRGNTTVPELQGTLLPTPGKTPTVGDITLNIAYANPNISAQEIGETVQTALEEAEAANG